MKKIILLIIITITLFLAGCMNGGGGGLGTIGNNEDYAESLILAWNTFNSQNYSKSLVDFNEVRRKSFREYDRDEARLGMGWSYLKMGDFEKALETFETVQTGYPELAIGKASIYILQPSKENYTKAFLEIKGPGLDLWDSPLNLSTPINISRIYCNALAGIILYYNGKDSEARFNFRKIENSVDVGFDQRLERIYEAVITELGL